MRKALIISGPFDDAAIGLLAQVMRVIEREQPEERFTMVIKDLEGDPTIEELADKLDQIFPTLPGDTPTKRIIPR